MKEETQYRLINKGEIIPKEAEMYLTDNKEWRRTGCAGRRVAATSFRNNLYRVPIESGWVALSDRKPTAADAGADGYIATWHPDVGVTSWRWDSTRASNKTHWIPAPAPPVITLDPVRERIEELKSKIDEVRAQIKELEADI